MNSVDMASVKDAAELPSTDQANINIELSSHDDDDDDDVSFKGVERKGPMITWTIDNFTLWHAGEEDLTSGHFSIADGTQWRICLKRATLEPVLVRDCKKGPTRVNVGFQFSVVINTNTRYIISKPLVRSFKDGDEHGCDWLLNEEEYFRNKEKWLPGDTLTLECHLWRDKLRNPSITVSVQQPKFTSSENYHFKLFLKKKKSEEEAAFDTPKSYDSPSPKEQTGHSVYFTYNQFVEVNPAEQWSLRIKHNKDKQNTEMTSKWFLLDKAGQVTDKQSVVFMDHFEEEGQIGKTPWLIDRKFFLEKKHLLKNKTDAIVRFEGSYGFGNGKATNHLQERRYADSCPLVGTTLRSDLGALLSSPEGCHGDMSVVSGDGVSFRVHRTILSARSPVFEAMMERDMSERQSGEVHIPDMEGTTLEQFLSFLYTAQLKEEEELSCNTLAELYAAGDKYEVLSLRNRCCALLSGLASSKNACDLLEFSELHSDSHLRGRALDVFCGCPEIFISEEWMELLEKRQKIVEEALEAVRLRKKGIQS